MIKHLLLFNLCFSLFAFTAHAENPVDSTFNEQSDAWAITVSLTTTTANCNAWGTATAIVTGGVSPYTYLWTGPGSFSDSGGPTTSDLFPGNYTLVVTDATGASATKTFIITGNVSTLSVVANANSTSCYNTTDGSISVIANNGSGDYYYNWSSGLGTGSSFIGNLAPGTYIITVTDQQNGCVGITEATVTTPPILYALSSTTQVSSYGGNDGSINITICGGVPPYSTLWSNGATTQDISNLTAGTYSMTLTDAAGCVYQYNNNNFVVNQPPANSNIFINAYVNAASCGSACNGTINIETQGNYTFLWTGPNGYTANQQNLNNLCPGGYNLKIVDSNGYEANYSYLVNGGSASIPLNLQSSNPGFCNSDNGGQSANCEKVCPNTAVTYSINPAAANCGGAPQFTWTVVGAQSFSISPDKKECTVVWGGPGAGSVSVSGSNNVYCYALVSRCISIIETPEAKFSTDPPVAANGTLSVCKGQTVWFKNQSLFADIYEWKFGDDLSDSNEKDPSHTFNAAGTFKVLLIARSLCLCSDTTELLVEVIDSGTPLLDCVSTICPGTEVTYTTDANCGMFNWTVSANGSIKEGGTTADDHVTVLWNGGAFGQIGLTVQACAGASCPQPAFIRIPIISDVAEIEGDTRVCPGSDGVYEIEAYGAGTYFTWTASANGALLEGQGTGKVKINWSADANPASWVAVQYENCYLGCSGSDTIWVNVLPPFGINGPLEVCDGLTGTFKANQVISGGLPVICNWVLFQPDGSKFDIPSASVNATMLFAAGPGAYRLIAVPVGAGLFNTCADSAEWKIQVAPKPPKPTGISGPAEFCPGTPLTYKALGYSPLNNIRWTIKNSNAVPVNDQGGSVNVSFATGTPRWIAAAQITADALGCISDTARFDVKEIPAFNFNGPTDLCEGSEGVYQAPLFSGVDYVWEILPSDAGVIKAGKGTSKAEVFWVKPGNHTLRLTICGKVRNKTVTILANPNPVPTAPAGLCPGVLGQASITGTYIDYNWLNESGDILFSGTSTVQLLPGTYGLSVTDQYGCSATTKFSIEAYPKPNITITTADPTGFCNNERTVTMFALTNKDAAYDYEWFRDGLPLGKNDSIYSTNQYGLYSATATNQFGCKASDGPILIFEYCGGVCHNPNHPPSCPPGTIGLDIDATPRCDSFQFHLLPSPNYQAGSAYWNFGESGSNLLGTSASDDPSFKFPNAGKYIVVLYAYLTNGALCKVLDSVRVEAVAQFDEIPGCPGDSTAFNDLSTFLADGAISNWQWNLGAGNASSLREPKFAFSNPGSYTVGLTVTANSGCTASVTRKITIPEKPAVVFNPIVPVCAGNATPLSIVPKTDLTKITWDFGDPGSGNLNTVDGAQVYHSYNTANTYTATATLENVAGCINTGTQSVIITPNNLSGVILPGGLSQICEGQSIVLTAPGTGVQYLWSNGTTGATLNITDEGVYKVTLTDANGCVYVTPNKEVQVNPVPDGTINAYLYNNLGQISGIVKSALELCEGENVHMIVSDNGSFNYQWSGSTTTDDELLFTDIRNNLLSPGSYTYSVTITNPGTGCKSVTPPFFVTIHDKPGNLSVASDQTCARTPTTISYTGPLDPQWQYLWNNGAVGTSFITEDAGLYFVRVVNEYGCIGQSPTVTIFPGPNIGAIPGGCHVRCDPDTLCVPPLPEIVSWQWFLEGTALSGAVTPNLVATQSGSYHVAMVDINGCTAESEPLNLTLYTGKGNIYGKVWSDVNTNGVIDAGDTLVQNIPVDLLDPTAVLVGTTSSAASGNFAFQDVLSIDYTVALQQANLPAGWKIIIGQDAANLYGCDDVEQVGLLIQPVICAPTASGFSVQVCANETYPYQGSNLAPGSSQTFNLKTQFGCDSLVTVSVAALPVLSNALEVFVCANEVYTYQGTNLQAGQTQDFTLKAANGCDSVVTLSIKAYPNAGSSVAAQVCAGGFYNYQGVDIAAGSTQDFVLQTIHGCDSLVTVSVGALPVLSNALEVFVCPNEVYTYQGTNLQAGQTQDFTLKAANGCDSIVILAVKAYPNASSTLSLQVCTGSFYSYQGVNVPAGSTQDFVLQTIHGCDSLVTVSVAALPVLTKSLEVFVCPNEVYTYQGTNLQAGQTQDFTLKTANGCDSIVTLAVKAYPNASSSVSAQVCTGSFYTYQGVNVPAGSTQDFVLQTVHGCDSLVTVSVAALPVLTKSLEVFVCPNEVYTYQGANLQAGQTQDFTLKTANGCDSVVTLSVKAYPIAGSTVAAQVCTGSFYNYQGVDIAPGSTQDFVLQTIHGCDSVVTVSVAALPIATKALEVYVCPNEVYTYQGANLQAGQTQDFILKAANGCDSIVTLVVKAYSNASSALSVKVCAGSFYSYQGVNVPAGSTQDFVLQTIHGCDSIVAISVQSIPTTNKTVSVQLCPGETYDYQGNALSPGNYTYQFQGYEGCDSTVYLNITASPALSFSLSAEASCPNKASGSIAVQQLNGNSAPYAFSLDGIQFQDAPAFTAQYAGWFTVLVRDSYNCIFKDSIQVDALPPLVASLPNGILACDSSSIALTPIVQGNLNQVQFKWWNGATEAITRATEAGTVWVDVRNACETKHVEAQIQWADVADDFSYAYLPNIFMPEAQDVRNASFRPIFVEGIQVQQYRLEIYDRWGNLIFQTKQADLGWEGTLKSKIIEPGVFVWILKADIWYCGRLIHMNRSGDVTIMR